MKRRRFLNQEISLQDRERKPQSIPLGQIEMRARQAETAMHFADWANSPELRPPK
jgi:hypothetical protein